MAKAGSALTSILLADISMRYMVRGMELSPTAYVILGMVSREPRSGYEIKALVDEHDALLLGGQLRADLPGAETALRGRAGRGQSTRPRGGRKRTVYEITADGKEELKAWLRQPPGTYEMREEGLLKLFFAGALPAQEAAEILRAMRDHRARRASSGCARWSPRRQSQSRTRSR